MDLMNNPPSLRLLSVSRIRESLSCMGQDLERDLIEKLTADDLHELSNPNVPVSLSDMCPMERRLLLESCLKSRSWGLLEMYILLTDDVSEFDDVRAEAWDLEALREEESLTFDIKLDVIDYEDLFLSLLMTRCSKLESLTWIPKTTSQTALQTFCAAMPHMTKLSLPCIDYKIKYDGILRAIAANMPHLKYLDIAYCTYKPKAIGCLLPTRDNVLGGCPELVELHLAGNTHVGVKLLKKIILALPKLRSLKHELLVNALGCLTEEEMGVDTARSLNTLYARQVKHSRIRFGILTESPVFQRLKNNITTVDIHTPIGEKGPNRHALANILMSLPKLKSVALYSISGAKYQVSSWLDSIGDRVEYLKLSNVSVNLNVQDIMRTCSNLVELNVSKCPKENCSQRNDNSRHQGQLENPSKLHVLHYLTELKLFHLGKEPCSATMLIALLQSLRVTKIFIRNIEVMSNDVMFNALSSRGCAALSKVTEFSVEFCPLITGVPFVNWIDRENCSLQYMKFYKCEKIDYDTLRAAAEECPRALFIIVEF